MSVTARLRAWTASPRRWQQLTGGFAASAVLLLLAGCGSGGTTYSTYNPAASAPPATETTTTTAAPPSSNYPVVHFTTDANGEPSSKGDWPFTIQVMSMTKTTEGVDDEGGSQPGYDWLMVRMSVTNQEPNRSHYALTLEIYLRCAWPGSPSYNSARQQGYETEAGTNQLALPAYVGMAPFTPQTYVLEWEVPEDLNAERVSCTLIEGPLGKESTLELT